VELGARGERFAKATQNFRPDVTIELGSGQTQRRMRLETTGRSRGTGVAASRCNIALQCRAAASSGSSSRAAVCGQEEASTHA